MTQDTNGWTQWLNVFSINSMAQDTNGWTQWLNVFSINSMAQDTNGWTHLDFETLLASLAEMYSKCETIGSKSDREWIGKPACAIYSKAGKIKWNLSSKKESIKKPLPPSIWPQFDFQLQIMKSLAFIWIFSLSGLLANHLPHEHWRKRHQTMMQHETTTDNRVSIELKSIQEEKPF